MEPMDVLVMENRRGVSWHDAESLRRAGHRVHTCHDRDAEGFPCRAVAGGGPEGGACPLESGIDVALTVRSGVTPHPSERELGIPCVLRAGIPLLESGTSVLDPFDDVITARVGGHAVAACEEAVVRDRSSAAARASDAIQAALANHGVDPATVDVEVTRTGRRLRLVVTGPDLPLHTRNALTVRALDGLRGWRPDHARDAVYRVR